MVSRLISQEQNTKEYTRTVSCTEQGLPSPPCTPQPVGVSVAHQALITRLLDDVHVASRSGRQVAHPKVLLDHDLNHLKIKL